MCPQSEDTFGCDVARACIGGNNEHVDVVHVGVHCGVLVIQYYSAVHLTFGVYENLWYGRDAVYSQKYYRYIGCCTAVPNREGTGGVPTGGKLLPCRHGDGDDSKEKYPQ